MNCKFHPGNESVVKCATCGVDMCDVCDKNAYYFSCFSANLARLN